MEDGQKMDGGQALLLVLQVDNKHSKEMLLLRARPCVSSELELCGRGTPLADTHQAPLQLLAQMPS